MNLSPLNRMVQVVYNIKNGVQIEEWTLAQCIKEKVPEHVMGQLLAQQTQSDPTPIESGEPADYPFSYQLMHEYSSTLYLKSTVKQITIGE